MAKRYKNIPVTINYDDQTLASTHSSTQIPSGNIAISDNGLNFMLAFDRYRGHQYWNGEKYVMGYNYSGNAFPNGITETNAYRLWLADVTKAQNALRKRLNNNPLFFLQHQWDALVSFYYNTGSINYTEIEGYEFDFLYFLQNGTDDEIASLLQTDNRTPTRRTAEASLFRLGNYGNIKPRIWLRNEGIQYIRQNYLKLEDKDGNVNKKAQQQAQYSYYLETGKFIKEISEIDRRRIIALIEQDADISIDTSTPIEQYIVKTTTDAEYSAITTTATATTTPALAVIDYSASAVGTTATTQTTTTTTTTSGSYNDLSNLPSLFSGSWNNLTNKPGNFGGASSGSAGTQGFVPAPAAGDQLKVLQGNGTWAAVSGGGSALDVEDEGSSLGSAVTKINFAGVGVTATASATNEILVAIPGGIALTDLSVAAEASAAGDGGIAYDNSNGQFQYTPPDVDHDSLTNFVANEHIDWTSDQSATDIHSGNYTNTTYSLFTTSAIGLAPILPASPEGKFLKGDGSWVVPPDTDTTYSLFTTSAIGLAPILPASHGGKFLKGDGTWVVPPDTDTTYSLFTTSAIGLAPILPNPHGGKFLKGDGSWEVPPDTNTTYSLFTTSAIGLAPTLPNPHGGKFLKGDGSWVVPPDTTYSLFTTSAIGLAPTLPNPHGGKFLKGDGSWVVPPDTDTTYSLFTTSAIGLAPTLPNPHGGKFLKGDGTWVVPPDTTYSLFTTSAIGLAPILPASHGGKFLKGDGTWEVPPDTDTTYSLFTTSAIGLAPTLPASHGGKFLKGDGSWEVPPDTDTTYSLFTTSAIGLAPTLPASHGGKFLKGDGSWEVPPDTNTTYSSFTGDTGSGGIAGLVPAPAAGDTSASKFLKANATWETLGGFSAVTDGALSDGEIVVQQLDGTVRAIGVLGTDYSTDMFERGTGSSTSYVFDNSTGNVSASYAEEISRFIAFDPNNANKFVVAYTDANNSDYGTAKVGTVSGTTITYGTAVVFASADTLVQAIVFDPHIATKFLVVYTDKSYAGNTNAGTIKVGTLSGTSITFGSAVTFNHDSASWPQNSRHISIAFDPSDYADPDSRFIVAYADGTAGSNATDSGTCQLGSTNYSGGPPDVSMGSQYTFNHDGMQAYPNVEFTSIAFDPHTDYRFVIAYMEDQSSQGNGHPGNVVVGKINDWQYSGTVLDFGEPNFEATYGPNGNDCVHIGNVAFDPFIANKYLLIYVREGGSEGDEYKAGATIGTIDDDTSTVGSEYLFFTTTNPFPERCTGAFDPVNANKFVVASNVGLAPPYVPAGPLERQGVVVGTISGTTITYSTQSKADDITTPDVSHMAITFDPNTKGNFVYAYRNDTDKGTAIVGSIGVSNLNNENFIGISDGAYADGANATIQISGSVDDAQTGLTPGSRYYVQSDGAISTTPDTGTSVHVGIALSATDLLQLNLPNKFDGTLELDGQIKITGGNPGANKVLTSDAIGLASWAAAAGGGGKIVQVVSFIKSDESSSASTVSTLAKVVDGSANAEWKMDITITSGNKVFCIMNGGAKVYGLNADASIGGGLGIYRDTTKILETNDVMMSLDLTGYHGGGTSYTAFYMPFTLTILDTPGVTNPTYYLAYQRGYQANVNVVIDHDTPFHVTLMEIQV